MVDPFELPHDMQAFDMVEMSVKLGFAQELGMGKQRICCWVSGKKIHNIQINICTTT